VLGVITVLPTLLLFDKGVRNDWVDILLLYMETMSITSNIYAYSFLGPNFQGRLRPMVYYENLPMKIRKEGANRNSFYSGHVSSATAATIFMAKVYSDYHPEIGNNKYLLYGAALIPPLILGYIRYKALYHFPSDILVGVGVGALCGILIPEFNLANTGNIKLSAFSSPAGTGLTALWQPNFLK
jgi:membrane-associated phospholipid phosphatase